MFEFFTFEEVRIMKKNPWLLILGGNSDIALGCAHQFAKNSFNIYLASRDMINLKKNANDISIRYDVDVIPVYFDSKDFKTHSSFYTSLQKPISGAIMAFGVMHDQNNSENDIMLAKDTIDTNYLGLVSITEIIANDFKSKKKGFITVITSVAGDRGRMSNYIYGSSKAAISCYLSGLRHKLFKYGINVIDVKPGFVSTKMTKNMNLPKLLTAKPKYVGKKIFDAYKNNKDVVYVKPIWRYIMFIIRIIPNFIFHKTNL